MRDQAIQIIKDILINELFVELPVEKIGLDDGLQSVVGLDSLGFVELSFQCEQRFNVKISEADFCPENFSTINKLTNLIQRLQRQSTTETVVA
jgi:acyl carrier protein